MDQVLLPGFNEALGQLRRFMVPYYEDDISDQEIDFIEYFVGSLYGVHYEENFLDAVAVVRPELRACLATLLVHADKIHRWQYLFALGADPDLPLSPEQQAWWDEASAFLTDRGFTESALEEEPEREAGPEDLN